MPGVSLQENAKRNRNTNRSNVLLKENENALETS